MPTRIPPAKAKRLFIGRNIASTKPGPGKICLNDWVADAMSKGQFKAADSFTDTTGGTAPPTPATLAPTGTAYSKGAIVADGTGKVWQARKDIPAGTTGSPVAPAPPNWSEISSNDTNAALLGVPVGGVHRDGNTLKVRLT